MVAGESKANSQAQWQPVLDDVTAERARESIRQVVDELGDNPTGEHDGDASLPGGAAGFALAFGYIAEAMGWSDLHARAFSQWEYAIARIADEDSRPVLHGGFVGAAWLTALITGLFLDGDADEDTFVDIDDALVRHLDAATAHPSYDLIAGLVGIGVYGLERLPSKAGERIVERVQSKLAQMSVAIAPGVTWLTPASALPPYQRTNAPDGYYNLGLAHGVPGVIGFLGRASGAGLLDNDTTRVLEDAVDWLVSQKEERIDGRTWYSNWRAVGSRDEALRSRVAWCYGDLGIAAALFVAGQCHGHADWVHEAIATARNCANIRGGAARVNDHGLCHGSAGIGLLFSRLANATGDDVLRDAASHWLTYTLDNRLDVGIGGYASWRAKDPTVLDPNQLEHRPDAGMLTGSAGVAMALAAGVTRVAPDWDRCLLISSKPREQRIH